MSARSCSLTWAPVNDAQRRAAALFRTCDWLFLLGPAGTGKTHTALGLALTATFAREVDRVWLTRPLVECGGERVGYLPGDLDEKLAPWLGPFSDVLGSMTHEPAASVLAKHAEVVPLAFIRGRTARRVVSVLDEAQNCTYSQLSSYLTRLGSGSKMILCGDPTQRDVNGNALVDAAKRLRGMAGVGVVVMQDSGLRHPRLTEMIRRLK